MKVGQENTELVLKVFSDEQALFKLPKIQSLSKGREGLASREIKISKIVP